MRAKDGDELADALDKLASGYKKDSWFERSMRNFFYWAGRYYRRKAREQEVIERASRGEGT